MRIWNTASVKIEGRYDGKLFEFEPDQKQTVYDRDAYNHLFFKLEKYGIVLLPEDATKEEEKKLLIKGLKARWKTLDFIVRNYRTMNKDREAMKLASEAPSDTVMNSAEEAANLLERLKELEGEKYKKVEDYLNDDRTKKAAEAIAGSEQTVETKGSFETKVGGKRQGKNAAASA